MSTAVTLAPTQLVPVVTWMEQSIETLDNLIELLPSYPDDQLVEAYKYGLRLDFCAWRLRAAVAAQVTTRINERQARGRNDLEGKEIKKVLLDLSAETGTDVSTLYKDAQIQKEFFSSRRAATRESVSGDLGQLQERHFYLAALSSPNPQETIETFAQEKAANPNFSTRDAWRLVKADKPRPPMQPLTSPSENEAIKKAWPRYCEALGELSQAASSAGLNLQRTLNAHSDELWNEINQPKPAEGRAIQGRSLAGVLERLSTHFPIYGIQLANAKDAVKVKAERTLAVDEAEIVRLVTAGCGSIKEIEKEATFPISDAQINKILQELKSIGFVRRLWQPVEDKTGSGGNTGNYIWTVK